MKKYEAPTSLREAWTIYSTSPSNVILGGCSFLRLGKKNIGTGIDLCNLELDYIKEHNNYIEIGAMTRLRTLETDPILQGVFDGILGASVSSIVGVSFRNTATIGGSVYGKYGFSDLVTALLALNAEIELYKGGVIALRTYLNAPPMWDILVSVRIPTGKTQGKIDAKPNKHPDKSHYTAFRHSAGDFPVLTLAISNQDEEICIAVGARPMRATCALKAMQYLNEIIQKNEVISAHEIEKAAQIASDELVFGSNMRGRAEYRKHLCRVLVERGLSEVLV